MPIIGWVSEILGWMINVIYSGLELIGITNIGLSIILFTLVVYLLMTPLQIKQQKFSKLNAVMQPEIQKIQKKYNGKKDQDSMMKQNEEISAVYQKYGVSPTGSCVQLLVQMPVLAGFVPGNLSHSWIYLRSKKRIYRTDRKDHVCRWIWQYHQPVLNRQQDHNDRNLSQYRIYQDNND